MSFKQKSFFEEHGEIIAGRDSDPDFNGGISIGYARLYKIIENTEKYSRGNLVLVLHIYDDVKDIQLIPEEAKRALSEPQEFVDQFLYKYLESHPSEVLTSFGLGEHDNEPTGPGM
ncbi:MAG: hypothetical protein C0602_08555 [Denitrovibrio sp.]|nr:MAG: hypothetical protein C0602_08555 [Denitrovibrio sp.]